LPVCTEHQNVFLGRLKCKRVPYANRVCAALQNRNHQSIRHPHVEIGGVSQALNNFHGPGEVEAVRRMTNVLRSYADRPPSVPMIMRQITR
jgi:hypothetical protein